MMRSNGSYQGKEITVKLYSKDRITHFGLNGRATNVFPATRKGVSPDDELVAKAFWGGETRLKADGSHVLYLIVFEKLDPITGLSGDQFLDTWFETAKCHLVLWKNGVYHRDVSPSSLMCRMVDGKIVGVLNDFDLPSIDPGVKGTDRTGTVPFMALPLLSSAGLNGDIKHLYEHDAESFIWVLTWVSLRYDSGKLREKNRPLDEWLKVDAGTCHKEKCGFLVGPDRHWLLKPGAGHERNWLVATECLDVLLQRAATNARRVKDRILDIEPLAAFQELLQGPLELCPPNPEN